MTQTVEALFDEGIQRYKDGESAEALLPLFKELCDRAPKNSSAWTCLSWVYLLADKPNAAFKAAQKAVKLNAQDPQARINLALAILDSDRKGVREQVDMASQILMAVEELRDEVKQNFEEALRRRPEWESLIRVQSWLFGG
jgi:predicted Zn-dependent protease